MIDDQDTGPIARFAESSRWHMNVLVSGDCSDWKFVKRKLDSITYKLVKPVIVTDDTPSGKLAQRWATENFYEYRVTHEKTLEGRHKEIVELSTAAVVFAFESWSNIETIALKLKCEKANISLRFIKCKE